MIPTPEQLAAVTAALLQDREFLSRFKSTSAPQSRRSHLHEKATKLGFGAETEKIEDRESIRLLVEELEGLYSPASNQETAYPLTRMRMAYGKVSDVAESPIPVKPTTPTTNTMSKAITVTTQVNINGVNADNYTDAQLFDMIRQQENEIKNLQALTNKPQSLLREIKTRQAGIDALVNFMNERDAKLNPAQLTTPQQPTATDQLARG